MKTDELRAAWREATDGSERLRWARTYWQQRSKAVGASAKDAADSIGMKDGTYRAYERKPSASKHTPLDHQAAIRFGKKFKVDWRWLLLGDGTPFDDQLPADQERVIRAMSSAEPSQQKALADMVEAFLGRTGTDG